MSEQLTQAQMQPLIDKAWQELERKIDTEARRINKKDPESPLINASVKEAMKALLGDLMETMNITYDIPFGQDLRSQPAAVDMDLFRQWLMDLPVIQNYGGPHDEVFVSLSGSVVKVAKEAMQRVERETSVLVSSVTSIAGFDKNVVDRRWRERDYEYAVSSNRGMR